MDPTIQRPLITDQRSHAKDHRSPVTESSATLQPPPDGGGPEEGGSVRHSFSGGGSIFARLCRMNVAKIFRPRQTASLLPLRRRSSDDGQETMPSSVEPVFTEDRAASRESENPRTGDQIWPFSARQRKVSEELTSDL